jgi:hypothetical protein
VLSCAGGGLSIDGAQIQEVLPNVLTLHAFRTLTVVKFRYLGTTIYNKSKPDSGGN